MPYSLPNFKISLRFAIILACLWTIVPEGKAQFWMNHAGGATVDEAYDIAIDANGNTYTVGYFTGTATFGGTTLTSNGNSTDIFLTKMDNQGNFDWAVQAGGSGSDRGLSVKIDAQGHSYITGFFNGTATFSGQTVTSSGLQDVFIAEYDNAGVLQWVERAGGADADIGNGICVDNSGNVIITGEFRNSATFGGTTINSAMGSTDIFITKLDGNGSFVWTKHGSGDFTDRGLDVACDAAGNVYGLGQFSDDLTFDNLHTNSMFNVIYLVKFDDTGAEQWFRIIGGGGSNIGNSISTDANGNSYITGDFTGNLTFFGPTNTVLNGTYTNSVFVAKYNDAGSVTWASESGSDNDITSRSVTFDAGGNAYIVGHFKCSLDGYSDVYGDGTFNSVGFNDIFAAEFDPNGSWQYARQLGSKSDDHGYGVAVNGSAEIHFAGSYTEELYFPTSANFLNANLANWNQVNCSQNAGYCSDPDYESYYGLPTSGNLDIVIANCFDPAREPYDYYERTGAGCVRDQGGVIIANGLDTIVGCMSQSILAEPENCPTIGPNYTYLWSNGALTQSIGANQNTNYIVTQTSDDGCFSSVDSIFSVVNPSPAPPLISDNAGVNTNTSTPQTINVCLPATVTITGSGFAGTDSISWTGPGLGAGTNTASIVVSQSGVYNFHVFNQFGCSRSISVEVNIFAPLPPFGLKMDAPDTVSLCEDDFFEVMLYDSITNPTINMICLDDSSWNLGTIWQVFPNPTTYGVLCQTFGSVYPTDTGWYTISVTLTRTTPCGTDTFMITDSVFAQVWPKPVIPPFSITIQGSPTFCPGDTTFLTATGGPGNYTWSTPTMVSTNATVPAFVDQGIYNVATTVSDTNVFGCTAGFTSVASVVVTEKPQPLITADTLFICPNDTVTLVCSNSQSLDPKGFHWEGPNGPVGDSTFSIQVTDPGSYFCVVRDQDSCNLVSNTILLSQYTTPSLFSNGNQYLCDGDSAVLAVLSSNGSSINWLPPLSGTNNQQTVFTPGTYSCEITSCNITSAVSIDVLASVAIANITQTGPLCLGETTTLIANAGMDKYAWQPTGDSTSSLTVSVADTFSLTTIDTNGCEEYDTVIVTMDQVPTLIGLSGTSTFCVGDSIVLTGNDSMASYLWTPGGATVRSIESDTSGTFTLTTIDTNGCSGMASVTVQTAPTAIDVAITGDLQFCEGDTVNFFALQGGLSSYTWNPGSIMGRNVNIQESGTYVLTSVDQFGCEAVSDPITVQVQPNILNRPVVSNMEICGGVAVSLQATSNAGTILWFENLDDDEPIATGPTLSTPVIRETTTYYVMSNQQLCSSEITPVTIEVEDCENIKIPNVFSPNFDGINDLFLVQLTGATCFNCQIYNRWGELIYVIDRMNMGWDGTVTNTGRFAPQGTYFYMIDYCRHDGTTGSEQGTVTLIRNSDQR